LISNSIPKKVRAIETSTESISLKLRKFWNDLFAIEVQAKSETEKRFALIGAISGTIWAVFFTERAEKIRIISARRARTKKEELYNERK
jgi:uncharacterized DUF497 family protein